jgi:tetratricopeptide (TPR) repeat protein
VFPLAAGAKDTECPLCLLRFEVKAELTQALPDLPVPDSVARAPGLDDLESFGDRMAPPDDTADLRSPGVRGTSTRNAILGPADVAGRKGLAETPGFTATIGGGRARPPTGSTSSAFASAFGVGTGRVEGSSPAKEVAALSGSAATEDSPHVDQQAPDGVHALGFTTADDGDVDFDSLLSDAVQAVEKRQPGAASRTNPFGRITAPRRGGGPTGAEDVVFTPGSRRTGELPVARPAPPAADEAELDSLFESEPRPAHQEPDEAIAVAVTRGTGDTGAAARPRPAASQRAMKSASPLDDMHKVLRLLLILAAVVGTLGMALEIAGFGWFGIRLWAPMEESTARSRNKPVAADLMQAVELTDTQATYETEVQRLLKIRALRPDDATVAEQLVERMLDLLERFPGAYEPPSEFGPQLEALQKTVKPFPVRYGVLTALARGSSDGLGEQLAELDQGAPDDQAVAVRVRLLLFERKLEQEALANPGLTASPDIDSLRQSSKGDKALEQAAKQMDALRPKFQSAPNRAKFAVLDAMLMDRQGDHAAIVPLLEPVSRKADDHVEARLVLASAHIEGNQLEAAETLAQEAVRLATEQKNLQQVRLGHLTMARIATRRGDRAAQVKALEDAIAAVPHDELTTIRLGRLLVVDKRADQAHKLYSEVKRSAGFKSVAFEVALVEYWLYVNRNQDALEEITAATKMYPDSVDLLFLRGEVEAKGQHSATARDFFSQVIAKNPRHLRASVRLAELQSQAGRHDEALATLQRARSTVGDDETLLRLASEELLALRRSTEARELLTKLLALQPNNRLYLLRAAQMDLQAGDIDRALGYLRRLRDQRALDREAAILMARALDVKEQPAEAAATLMPFAEAAPDDVQLNAEAGRCLVDAKEYDRAQTVLERATKAANGKDAEALFQYGRLAFRRGEVDNGVSRVKQAIGIDALAHEYRYELARNVFDLKPRAGDTKASGDEARTLGVAELTTILGAGKQYADAGRPVKYLDDVHRLLARDHLENFRYAKAVPHLRATLELKPDDVDTLVNLGRCLYHTASPEADKVLRHVLAKRPSDGTAALYLGLNLLNKGKSTDAMDYLKRAADQGIPELAEAWYHIALVWKERNQTLPAVRAVNEYLRLAPPDDPYRKDAESLRRGLGGK